jgi:3-hydroxyisobutyrate dehydrogenase-like beta-hydroxyacid dehydrogenase
MSEVSLIGLGAMGSAIAGALIGNDCDLTVWNRSPAKADRIVKLGAKKANSLEQAVAASPRLIICIHGYAATRDLLRQPEVGALLSGKTVIQMSTGTPREAKDAERWINERGGNYLDCAIMVYPETVGTSEGQLFVSGQECVYQDCDSLIGHLGGDVRYLGANIGAAAALDIAVVSRLVAITIGVIHGANVCQSEGVSLEQFASVFPKGDRARSLALAIHNEDFEDNVAVSVAVAIEVISSIKSQAADMGINSELPDFLLGLYDRAVAAGYRQHDVASLIRILRADSLH